MTRFKKAIEIVKHKNAMYKLWRKQGGYKGTNVPFIRVLFHDLTKIFSVVLIGQELTKQFHSQKRHHLCLEIGTYPSMCLDELNGEYVGDKLTEWFSEAYLDWACSRMTKADKQLDAVQTAEKLYEGFVEVSKAYFKKYNYK